MEVMRSAERIGCNYLGVYPEDVLKAVPGRPGYDPAYENALRYGAAVVAGREPPADLLADLPPEPPSRPVGQPRQRPGGLAERIKANDRNGDGMIAKDEASDRLEQFFDRVDANQDGFIDERELQEFARRFRGGPRPGARPSRPGSGVAGPVAVPDNVDLVTDVAYRDGNEKWRLDLAMPKERGDVPRPAIVFVHGGGWRSGDKSGGNEKDDRREDKEKNQIAAKKCRCRHVADAIDCRNN